MRIADKNNVNCIKDRTTSLYVSSRFTSSNLKNIGSECALNELLFTALQWKKIKPTNDSKNILSNFEL